MANGGSPSGAKFQKAAFDRSLPYPGESRGPERNYATLIF